MKPSIDLITEATKVWSRLRRGEITYSQLESELKAIEARHGMPTGDEVDRGWNAYNDHREQIGGRLG